MVAMDVYHKGNLKYYILYFSTDFRGSISLQILGEQRNARKWFSDRKQSYSITVLIFDIVSFGQCVEECKHNVTFFSSIVQSIILGVQ